MLVAVGTVEGGFRVVSTRLLPSLRELKVDRTRRGISFQGTVGRVLLVLVDRGRATIRRSRPTFRTVIRIGKAVAPVAEVRAVRGTVLVAISPMFRTFGRKVTTISVRSGTSGMPTVDPYEDGVAQGVVNVIIA